jgi:hypothetical protein
MPNATIPTKVAISCGFSALRRMIISGADSAITLIMKASTVPSAAPLPISASTMGMMPAALVYIGTPMATAAGTDHQGASLPMIEAMKSCATQPWMQATGKPCAGAGSPGRCGDISRAIGRPRLVRFFRGGKPIMAAYSF